MVLLQSWSFEVRLASQLGAEAAFNMLQISLVLSPVFGKILDAGLLQESIDFDASDGA